MKRTSSMLIAALMLTIFAISSCTSNKAKEVTLNDMKDSINYLVAYWNGDMMKQHVFHNDSNHKQLNVFLKALDEAFKGKTETDIYQTGVQVGMHFKDQIENGYFGDEDAKANAKMLMKGLINALNDYDEIMNSTEADSIVRVFQTNLHEKMNASPSLDEYDEIMDSVEDESNDSDL